MKKLVCLFFAAAILAASGCGYFTEPIGTQTPTALPTAADDSAEAFIPTPEVTDAPTPAPTSVPTAEPTATPLVTSLFKSRVNALNLRAEPNTDSAVVATIGFEETVEVIDAANEDFLRVLYNGAECYCANRFVVPASEQLYGYLAPMYEYKKDSHGNIEYESDGVTPITLKSELIDLRLVIPDITVYQIFGTDKNFTGRVLYKRPVPVLQTATAKKLAAAADRFRRDGYTIKLYDSYRPKSVQFILYDIVQNSAYIANPYNSASNHNRAAAVDITLLDRNGKELEFPTPMHTFTKKVYRSSASEWTDEQRRNVDYMTNVMLDSGFKLINTEWWHFSDTDYPSFIVMDIDMADIPMYTAYQLGYDRP
ncbi:MAG: SH3 domain-containing protein [Clostridia bacterium]|nr:SH3 domain-containing protein [Clostridia bacterium]MBQ4341083.1 SH3 domain-containing protein [Clostridia bacterium]